MKKLFLLRHAKSSAASVDLGDFERPLNDRGRAEAQLVGEYLSRQVRGLDFVVSSPAMRARETVELVGHHFQLPEVRFDDRIYEASPVQLLEVISEFPQDRTAALLVGHNPGIEELVRLLTGSAAHLNPAALVQIVLEGNDWADALKEKGNLLSLVTPKELETKRLL